MTQGSHKLLAAIRCGEFVATSHDHFALSFQIIRMRQGVPRLVCVHGAMPIIETKWRGSEHAPHRQSLN
jgi:hypothetical protein